MKISMRIFGTFLLCVGLATPAHAAGDSTTYTYDGYGRLWTVTYSNGTKITYTYDNAGNRQAIVTTCSSSGC